MAQKFNSEFNYRTQVIWETIWEKIKTLQGFLIWRKRAEALEEIQDIKLKAKKEKVKYIRQYTPEKEYEAMELEAEIMEIESTAEDAYNCYRLNDQEIIILERLLNEAYEIANKTRLTHEDWTPFSDEEMFEANAANEFTAMIWKEIYAEILANGRPSPAKIRNAMSCPQTWASLQSIWLIPKESSILLVNDNPKEELLYLPTIWKSQS